jgi:hypothetical protein
MPFDASFRKAHCGRMLWLIKPDLASSGKPHLRTGTPARLLDLRAPNALARKVSYLGLQIVAQEVELLGPALLRGVNCGLSRRHGEEQPAMSSIYRREFQNISKKRPIRLGVLTVDNYVSTKNHLLLLKNILAGR